MENKIIIQSFWGWNHQHIGIAVKKISGGGIPSDMAAQLANELSQIRIGKDSELYDKALTLMNHLGQTIPQPEPIAAGNISGVITDIPQFSCELNGDIHMQYKVAYTNERESTEFKRFIFGSLSEFQKNLIKEINRKINEIAWEGFNERYGGGKIDLKGWKAQKKNVFISYRATSEKVAREVFDALGEYEGRTVFTPRLDRVDLQSGNWIEQLQDKISQCEIFIPVLTQDYRDGPIAKEEFSLAFRQVKKGKVICPVLVDGEISEYDDSFIGNYNIINATGGITDEKVEEIANSILGISKNPFE